MLCNYRQMFNCDIIIFIIQGCKQAVNSAHWSLPVNQKCVFLNSAVVHILLENKPSDTDVPVPCFSPVKLMLTIFFPP